MDKEGTPWNLLDPQWWDLLNRRVGIWPWEEIRSYCPTVCHFLNGLLVEGKLCRRETVELESVDRYDSFQTFSNIVTLWTQVFSVYPLLTSFCLKALVCGMQRRCSGVAVRDLWTLIVPPTLGPHTRKSEPLNFHASRLSAPSTCLFNFLLIPTLISSLLLLLTSYFFPKATIPMDTHWEPRPNLIDGQHPEPEVCFALGSSSLCSFRGAPALKAVVPTIVSSPLPTARGRFEWHADHTRLG